MHTAATCGQVGSPGSGRRALAARLRTLPGVSAPSSVVRSTMEIAVSMAHALAVVLMDRVLSTAVRASAPTWSTPGRPCRKVRKAASERVTSPYGGSGALVSGVSADSAPGASTWVMRSFSPAAVATTARITRAEQVLVHVGAGVVGCFSTGGAHRCLSWPRLTGFRLRRQPDGRWRTWRPDGTEILIAE